VDLVAGEAPSPLPTPFASTAWIDSTAPQSSAHGAAGAAAAARGLSAAGRRAGDSLLSNGLTCDCAPGSQPIVVAMPAKLNTITVIAAISIKG